MTQPRGKVPTIRAKPVRSAPESQTGQRSDAKDLQKRSDLNEAPESTERSGVPVRPPERLYSGW